MNNRVTKKIFDLKNIFSFFDEVYLFGSVLVSNAPNDIDILLIYQIYSPQVQSELTKVSKLINQKLNDEFFLDFTVLSKNELVETQFLVKTPHYLKIKP